jgi:F0F1-type ATP synthase assembly protein I
MVVGLWVTIFVAESHPLKRFKESGWPVAAFYVVAHLLYGLVIGIVLGFFALDKMGTNPISY